MVAGQRDQGRPWGGYVAKNSGAFMASNKTGASRKQGHAEFARPRPRRDCYDRAVPLNVWGFAAVTVPLVATPGASTSIVLRNSLAGGARSGDATAIGANAGSICYGLLTAFGLALALQRNPLAWTLLRLGGTAYLAWLGLRSLRAAFTYRQPSPGTAPSSPAAVTGTQRARRFHHEHSQSITRDVLPPHRSSIHSPRRARSTKRAGLDGFPRLPGVHLAPDVGHDRRNAVAGPEPEQAAPHPRGNQRRGAALAGAQTRVRAVRSRRRVIRRGASALRA